MNDHFDTILSDALRHRAAAASRPSRGLGDVRRRVRRRRQRHMAVGLVPAVAGLGWAVTRPVGHTPLSPAGGADPCGQTQPTWNDTLPANVASTIATIEAGGSTIVITAPTPTPTSTTITWEGDGNIVGSYGDTVALSIPTDPNGNGVVPYTGPTAPPPFMVDVSTSVPTDSDGGAVVDTTWSGNATTTTMGEATTTTICWPVPLPDSSIPSSESPTTSYDTVTTTTAAPRP